MSGIPIADFVLTVSRTFYITGRAIPSVLSNQTVVSYTGTVARVTVVVRTVTAARAVTDIAVISFIAFIETHPSSLVADGIFTLSWACLRTRVSIFPD